MIRLRCLWWHVIWWWQRRTRGFDNREWRDFRTYGARLLLPRLQCYKAMKHGHPVRFSAEQWDDMVDAMLFGLEFYASDSVEFQNAVRASLADAGMRMLGKNWGNLWD